MTAGNVKQIPYLAPRLKKYIFNVSTSMIIFPFAPFKQSALIKQNLTGRWGLNDTRRTALVLSA